MRVMSIGNGMGTVDGVAITMCVTGEYQRILVFYS